MERNSGARLNEIQPLLGRKSGNRDLRYGVTPYVQIHSDQTACKGDTASIVEAKLRAKGCKRVASGIDDAYSGRGGA
jgi:hypothetical protein